MSRHPTLRKKPRIIQSDLGPIDIGVEFPEVKPIYNRLAKLLIHHRGERSIRKFANLLKIPHTTLQKLEQGQIPHAALFLRLLRDLDVIDAMEYGRLLSYTE